MGLHCSWVLAKHWFPTLRNKVRNLENALKLIYAGKSFKIGDRCRAPFGTDSVLREGTIQEISNQFALVHFIGYGDTRYVSPKDLSESLGEAARQDQIRLVIGQMFPTETLEWFVGDYCRAVCDYDGLERECQIVQQNETDTKIFLVAILGDGRKEVKNRHILKESMGETERQKQIELLSIPLISATNCVIDVETQQSTSSGSHGTNADLQQNFVKLSAQFNEVLEINIDLVKTIKNNEGKLGGNFEKIWREGDFCRVICDFDNQEHEAKILRLHPTHINIIDVEILGMVVQVDIYILFHLFFFKQVQSKIYQFLTPKLHNLYYHIPRLW